jgi:hypothetical protein
MELKPQNSNRLFFVSGKNLIEKYSTMLYPIKQIQSKARSNVKKVSPSAEGLLAFKLICILIFQVEIDYIQCTDLDMDAVLDTTNSNPEKSLETIPDLHKPAMDANAIKDAHDG